MKKANSLSAAVAFCLLLFFVVVGHALATAGTLRTVVLSGAQAPDTADGVEFFRVDAPVLNNVGQTAFFGVLTGTGVNGTNATGIWSEGGGSGLTLVARAGNAAPGTSAGDNFYRFSDTVPLNSAGKTAFWGELSGSGEIGSNDFGIWSGGSENGLTLVVRTGDAVPGISAGVNFARFDNYPAFNSAGQTAFRGTLNGTGVINTNNVGIWSEGGGDGLALVAREGNAAPGTATGVIFASLFSPLLGPSLFQPPVLNSEGQVAFRGALSGNGVDSKNNIGIWSGVGGNGLALVVRSGNAAPNTPTGVNFSVFDSPILNSAGQTAFRSVLSGTGVDDTNDIGIWSEGGGGGLALVAREGNAAPGTPAGVNFSIFGAPVLNSAGQMVFKSTLSGIEVDGTNDSGIWSQRNGLSLVARAGDAAPGLPAGANFSSFSTPALNNAGQIAFWAGLTGTGIDNSNSSSIWAEDPQGGLTLIVRSGDLLDIDDGPGTEFRTISRLSFYHGSNEREARGSGLNNLGQLAFRASFTDGSSGVFVSNLVAVPEPSALLLAVVGLLGLSATRLRCQGR